jgi:hypothetical protein
MQFLNPLMLWGALAVGIPIALHFWHQKKGQLLNWAATQWLTEKDLQQSKGIRLDNIILLIIRCLLLFLLVFLLSKPIINGIMGSDAYQKIHLVQANSLVVSNYRFELEEALNKGEKAYWIDDKITPVEDLTKLPFVPPLGRSAEAGRGLQTCINKVYELNHPFGKAQYELYLVNNQSLSQVSTIIVPSKFSLHSVIDSTQKTVRPYLELSDKRKLFVNAANQLTVAPTSPPNEKFEAQPEHRGAINVLLENADKAEKQTITAALKALNEIYQLEFSIDDKLASGKKYNWIFTNEETPFDAKAFSEKIKTIPFSLIKGKVSNGQLPEYLGELVVQQFELNPKQTPLSQQQLQSLFKTESAQKQTNTENEAWFSKLLVLIFVITLVLERWLDIQKNA